MGPNSPGRAEVIRACQRDNEFINRLKEDIDDMILEVFGQRVWMRYQECSKYGSGIIYYALTNWLGYQTLGEEYVGLVQVDDTGRSVPSTKAVSLMIFSQVLATPFFNYVLKMVESFKQRQSGSQNLPWYLNRALDSLVQLGRLFQRFLPLLSQLHLAIFYVNGRFYEFSKRLANINYFLVRGYFRYEDAINRQNLKYLMWLSVVNLGITAFHSSHQYFLDQTKNSHNYLLAPILTNCSRCKKIKREKYRLVGVTPSVVQNDENISSHKKHYSFTLPSYLGLLKQGNDVRISSSISDGDPTKKCSLCLEFRRRSCVTPCGHLFCWDCIMDWLRNECACPICRESITPSRVVPLQNFT